MKIKDIFKNDNRVKELFEHSKEKYKEADLAQHNWDHITSNLYRALKIAETKDNINYSILIPAVLLHDIGVTEGGYKGHGERSIKIAERMLPDKGFNDEEIKEILHCIETTSEGAESKTIEAKINSDADKLTKAGFASIVNFFRVQKELDKDLEEMLKDLSKYENLEKEGFYTQKAEEIGKNGFRERINFLEKYRKELEKRPDITAKESDL